MWPFKSKFNTEKYNEYALRFRIKLHPSISRQYDSYAIDRLVRNYKDKFKKPKSPWIIDNNETHIGYYEGDCEFFGEVQFYSSDGERDYIKFLSWAYASVILPTFKDNSVIFYSAPTNDELDKINISITEQFSEEPTPWIISAELIERKTETHSTKHKHIKRTVSTTNVITKSKNIISAFSMQQLFKETDLAFLKLTSEHILYIHQGIGKKFKL